MDTKINQRFSFEEYFRLFNRVKALEEPDTAAGGPSEEKLDHSETLENDPTVMNVIKAELSSMKSTIENYNR